VNRAFFIIGRHFVAGPASVPLKGPWLSYAMLHPTIHPSVFFFRSSNHALHLLAHRGACRGALANPERRRR
jgi:hypothetical protein